MTSNVVVDTLGADINSNDDSLQEIGLRLPHLNTVGASDRSSTNEPLILGLMEKVVFEVWTEFDELLSETLKSISTMGEDNIHSAQGEVHRVIKKVNRVFDDLPDEPSSPVEERKRTSDEVCYGKTPLYHGKDPRVRYASCTSLDVYEDIFTALLEILSPLYRGTYNLLITTNQYSLVGMPRVQRTRSPIPDRSLCTVWKSLARSPPVCSFELKGPTVKFAEHVAKYWEQNVVAKTGTRRSVAQKAGAGRHQTREASDEIRGCRHEASSNKVCSYLNFLFESRKVYNHSSESSFINKKVAKTIAQTLIQALTTATGCAFLLTYEVGIAFELTEFGSGGKIIVQTSPIFCCGNQKGSLAAMLTLACHALKKGTKKQDLVAQFARLVVGNADGSQAKRQNRGKKKASDSQSRDNPPSDGDSREQKPTQNSSREHSATNYSPHTKQSGRSKLIVNDESDMSDVTEYHPLDEAEELLYEISKRQNQILGSGSSGLVVSSLWQGRKVALKLWNGEEEEGLHELQREVEIYKYMEATAPSLLGTVVPKAILALDTTARDGSTGATVALVTDYVGEGLSHDVKGDLWVSEGASCRRVGPHDKQKICDAALRSIEVLHQNNIVHGDIELHNLRVEAEVVDCTEGSSFSWKAWWIDYGKASVGSDPPVKFEYEQKLCASLFDF